MRSVLSVANFLGKCDPEAVEIAKDHFAHAVESVDSVKTDALIPIDSRADVGDLDHWDDVL